MTNKKHTSPFFSSWKLPTLSLAFTAGLMAQGGTPVPTPETVPFAHPDAAKMEQTKDPSGAGHLRHAVAARGELGATADDTFQLINVVQDDMGGTHARLQQFFKGVKVVNGQVISHANGRGEFSPFTNALKTRIGINTVPALSAKSVLDYLARVTGPAGPETTIPTPELVILPVMERYVIATGVTVQAPVPTPGVAGNATPKPATEGGGEMPADPMNSAQTARRVKEYHLVYDIRVAQGHEAPGSKLIANQYYVDANTGAVLSQRSLNESATGQGNGFYNPGVTFNVAQFGLFSAMIDTPRNFTTLDYDHPFAIFDPVNFDTDNKWGDGLAFKGDAAASVANRQTYMVDAMFGASVYWDMIANVFKRKGPDNKSYPVNVYVHAPSANADYNPATGNISISDPIAYQNVDVIGHESGHGLSDFTAHLGATGEAGGLNESDSDIWGIMSRFYLKGNGFSGHLSTIPLTAPGGSANWVNSVNRSMIKPSLTDTSTSDYWFPSIGTLDPHYVLGPNNRAFYFLSQGATARLSRNDSSTTLPWGMVGLQNQKAAQIWFDALTGFLPSDADYNDARTACILAAMFRFGPISKEVNAVENAYAAVNVGFASASSPAPPPVIYEVEPNNTTATAMAIATPNNWVQVSPGWPTANKVHIVGGGTDDDYYSIKLDPNETITVRLESGALTDYDVRLCGSGPVCNAMNVVTGSVNGMGSVDQFTYTVPAMGMPQHTYYLRISQADSKTPFNFYQLYIDFI